MSLKELLLFFENQENQIERKIQILFVFIGLLLTLSFNIFHNFTKFEQISLIISLIMIGIFCVSSFFPLGTYVNSSSKFVNKNS